MVTWPGGISRRFLLGKLAVIFAASTAVVTAGCGGGGGGSSPAPLPTATPRPTPTPAATAIPGPIPTPAPLPFGPFDLRGRVLLDGAPTGGILVTVTGSAGAVTGADQTVTAASGQFAFLLGAGTYTVTAATGGRSASRSITLAGGGQSVDNFDLAL